MKHTGQPGLILFQTQRHLWKPPDEGALKINFDVAVKANWLCAAAVCRDSRGNILRIRLSKTHGSSPLKGEARAARWPFLWLRSIRVILFWWKVILLLWWTRFSQQSLRLQIGQLKGTCGLYAAFCAKMITGGSNGHPGKGIPCRII